MCGITGYVDFTGRPASTRVVQAMADMIRHRGPDDEGVYVEGALALGHRRLSIIDLSTAASQPMASPDGRYVIVYNGEIYNFKELRIELQSKGVRFNSHSDTEVLLRGFEMWNEAILSRLNGIFAFAIWDNRERKLLLARDRYGVKPLYVAEFGQTLAFGSEIKAFLAHPDFSANINQEALVEYFTFQNFFTQQSLFKNVRSLPAGHYQWVEVDGRGAIPSQQYWDYTFQEPDTPGSEEEYIEELDRLFQQAVRRQLMSDVEIGTYLSGGMDSGSIAAVASRDLGAIKSFTVGFDMHSAAGLELAFDERERAEFLSYKFGTEHYEMVLKAGDMERSMRRLTWHIDEPRVGQSYPNFFAANLASRFCKVVLAGAGGDELFGGYPWRYYRAVVNDGFSDYVEKYFSYWSRLLSHDDFHQLFSPLASVRDSVDLRAIFRGVFPEGVEKVSGPSDYVNHSLYLEAKTFLHGLLVIEDKVSMAYGLESRVPFLDNDLVDFAMRVPVSMKLGNLGEVVALNENEPGRKTRRFFERTRDGKLLLRSAMKRYVPEQTTLDVKQGFSAPDASWFKGESIEYVKKCLLQRDAAIFSFIDRSTVHRLVNDHLEGRENRRLLIWSLLSIEEWINVFLLGAPIDGASKQHWA